MQPCSGACDSAVIRRYPQGTWGHPQALALCLLIPNSLIHRNRATCPQACPLLSAGRPSGRWGPGVPAGAAGVAVVGVAAELAVQVGVAGEAVAVEAHAEARAGGDADAAAGVGQLAALDD